MTKGQTSARRPTGPFLPRSFNVEPIRTTATKTRGAQAQTAFDVRMMVDGFRYFRRFKGHGMTKAAINAGYVTRLRQDHLKGWHFDPASKTFVDPAGPALTATEQVTPTVFSEAVRYMARRWPELEPRTRQAHERALRRAVLHLLRAGPAGPSPIPPGIEAWLTDALAPPFAPELAERRTADWDKSHAKAGWLLDHSKPFAEVSTEDLVGLLDRYAYNQRSEGRRRVDASTEQRFIADLRPFWRDAVDRLDLDKNPWDKEALRKRGSGPGKVRQRARRDFQVDKDVVLSHSQIRTMALATGLCGRWGPRAICYTLLMGWAGLRPGEAAAVRVSNLVLPVEEDHFGWVTVDRTRRMGVTSKWIDPDEDLEEGPLKGRGDHESRRVPLYPELVTLLRLHIDRFTVSGSDLLFVDTEGRSWDPNAHWEQVWLPARSALYPSSDCSVRGRKLAGLRRHDLRHAACSAWLNAGVSPKLAQQWSGHTQLSVFLDVYQGVVDGEVAVGLKRLASYTERSNNRGSLTSG